MARGVDALLRSIGQAQRAARPGEAVIKTLIESFRYPRKGPGMMWDAAAAKVKAQGGDIRMGHRLENMSCDARQGRVDDCYQDPGRRAHRPPRGTSFRRRRCAS